MTWQEIVQILTAGLGALGYALIYNIRGKKLVMASLGGLLSWTLFVMFSRFIDSEPIKYFLVAALISAYSEIMARVLTTPTTTFIMTALIPLIPGGSLYYTMAYAFESDMNAFLEQAIHTLKLASALALGILLTTAGWRFITGLMESKRRNNA